MNTNNRKKTPRGRGLRFNTIGSNDNRSNFKNQDSYNNDRRKSLSDATVYNISRYLMGNEIQILTKNDRIEGVLRGFDSSILYLSKVVVYDFATNDNVPLIKCLLPGTEVHIREVLMLKVLSTNGKTDNALIDQEISQRKQGNKCLQPEDKNLVPYFDEFDPQLEEDKDGDDLSLSIQSDNYWHHPEEMMKVNEERFNIKSTFNDNMEEYTTQIDKSDPRLQEKIDRAEKIVRDMENDAVSSRMKHLEDNEEEQDEEMQFSAVASVGSRQDASVVPATSITARLNPNAPEFRPRQMEDTTVANIIVVPDSVHQQIMVQRFAQAVSTPPVQSPRVMNITSQWTMPMQTAPPVHFVYPNGQVVQSGYQTTRQLGQECGPSPGLVYTMTPFGQQFFVQPDQLAASMGPDAAAHLYGQQLEAAGVTSQLRQPHIMPMQQQQQMGGYYAQSPHALMAPSINGGQPNYSQHVFIQPTQMQNPVAMQGYISNGRS